MKKTKGNNTSQVVGTAAAFEAIFLSFFLHIRISVTYIYFIQRLVQTAVSITYYSF